MLARLVRTVVGGGPRLARTVARRSRPRLVAYSLTDAPFVEALRRASDTEAVVAVYDDSAAPYAAAATLERELDVSVSPGREVALPSIPHRTFARTRRPVQARALADADPPVVLLSRRSLRDWDEQVRNFVVAHEFGHLRADASATDTRTTDARATDANATNARTMDAVAESLLPAPGRSALAVRELVAAHREYRAGEAHATIRADLSERHRTPPAAMAEYHAAERIGDAPVLSPEERHAVEVRNAAKYLPLPYDPPGIGDGVRAALAKPFSQYTDWVMEEGAKVGTRT